jgi:NADH dehydrogenase/NADH:ubiquinone oxidoreductase subunit G
MPDLTTSVPSGTAPQKSWIVRGVAVAAAIGILALVLPIVYFAFLSTLGLVGIGITAALGYAFIQALPMLGQKWENKLLGLRKAEARANPIEQIQNNVIRKAQQLKAFKDGMEVIGGQIGSLESSLKEQARRDPDDDLSDQWAAVAKMKDFYEKKKANYLAAAKALEEYKKAVERAKFKFGFGTAAQGIANAMNDADAKTLMENMLADEAFAAVDQRYNQAFAALDMDSLELSSSNRLEFSKGMAIDVQAIHIPTPEAVLVGRK